MIFSIIKIIYRWYMNKIFHIGSEHADLGGIKSEYFIYDDRKNGRC